MKPASGPQANGAFCSTRRVGADILVADAFRLSNYST